MGMGMECMWQVEGQGKVHRMVVRFIGQYIRIWQLPCGGLCNQSHCEKLVR